MKFTTKFFLKITSNGASGTDVCNSIFVNKRVFFFYEKDYNSMNRHLKNKNVKACSTFNENAGYRKKYLN